MNLKNKNNSNTKDNRTSTNFNVMLEGYSKFENYSYNNNFVIASCPIEFDPLYNRVEVLNNIFKIGKDFYKILEPYIKENFFTDLNKSQSREVEFVKLDKLNNNIIDNCYIKKLVSEKIINNADTHNQIKDKVLEFCTKNGFPFIDDSNSFDVSEEENEKKKNKVKYGYFFNVQPFISLSVIIYILFELQNAITNILEFTDFEEANGISNIKNMFPNKFDRGKIREYLNTIQKLCWIFNDNYTRIEDIDISKLNSDIIYLVNMIQQTTIYLSFYTKLMPSKKNNKIAEISEVHHNLLSIAFEQLKKCVASPSNTHIRKCENCGVLFETTDNREIYCQDFECQNVKMNISSKNSYEKKKTLQADLKKLFNNLTSKEVNLLDKNIYQEIKICCSYNSSQLKKNSTIESIEKYINVLENIS